MTESVTRQHESTSMGEVRGAVCHAFLVVRMAPSERRGTCYLLLDGEWHRFFLDAGLLFWRSGSEPNTDDDLGEGEYYIDMMRSLDVSEWRWKTPS